MMKQRYAFGIALMGMLFGVLLGAGRLAGQTTTDHRDDHGFTVNGKYYGCGTAWAADYDYEAALEQTRINNPARYEQMVTRTIAREKGFLRPSTQSGADWTFYMTDRANPESGFKDVGAILRYNGDSILIWVDEKDNALIRDETIEALAKGLAKQVKTGPNTRDPNKGIVFNDMDIFGRPPLNQGFEEHIASFLLTDIEEPPGLGGGGVIEGYFSPYDQTDRIGSNRTNILYIDSRQSLIDRGQTPGAIEGVIGTMAHEFQHLINHQRYQSTGGDVGAHWIYNEGLSEVASLRNGYSGRTARLFLNSPNRFHYFSFPSGNADTILRGYERAMLWVHYLSERFGDAFLYELTSAGGQGLEPARKAMEVRGLGSDIESVFGDFWVANYIRSDSKFQGDPKYRYQFDVTGGNASTASQQTPSTTKSGEVLLKGYGAYLPLYTKLSPSDPDALRIRFEPAQRTYAVYAVKRNRDNGPVEVQKLNIDQQYTFERYSSMIFVIVNLYGDGNTVRWTVEGFTSGVADYATDRKSFGLTTVAPNPVRGEARFGFHTSEPGSVDLKLYDIRGEVVLDILDGIRFEAGRHSHVTDLSNLPAGVYTARLRKETGEIAVQQFIVVK